MWASTVPIEQIQSSGWCFFLFRTLVQIKNIQRIFMQALEGIGWVKESAL